MVRLLPLERRPVLGKSKASVELEFLTSLEQGEVTTQARLSKRIAVSVGLINALLRRAMHKGYVKAKAAPYKRYAYYLTPKGFAEKSRLVAEYLETSLDFFRTAREEYGEAFARARAAGLRRLAFVGGSELAEIALLAARQEGMEIVCILDREINEEQRYGITVVRAVEDLQGVEAVVVTDARRPQRTFDLLRQHFDDLRILTPPFLRIARAPLDFKPKLARQ